MSNIRVAPDHLKEKAPAAYAFWNAYAPTLADSGALTEQDALAFEELAVCYQLIVAARDGMLDGGVAEADRAHGGMLKKSPYFQMWRDSMATFMRLSARFGILPSDRKALGSGAPVGLSLEDILA